MAWSDGSNGLHLEERGLGAEAQRAAWSIWFEIRLDSKQIDLQTHSSESRQNHFFVRGLSDNTVLTRWCSHRKDGSVHSLKLYQALSQTAHDDNNGKDQSAKVAIPDGRTAISAALSWFFYVKKMELMDLGAKGAEFVEAFMDIPEKKRSMADTKKCAELITSALERPAQLLEDIQQLLLALAVAEEFGGGNREKVSEGLLLALARRVRDGDVLVPLAKEVTAKLLPIWCPLERMSSVLDARERKRAAKKKKKKQPKDQAIKDQGSNPPNGAPFVPRKGMRRACRFPDDCWKLGDCGWFHTKEQLKKYAEIKANRARNGANGAGNGQHQN